jgi:enolase-phosphatase E1
LFEDVEQALKLWTSSGKQVYIYSSGSVEAQKLLFEHSVAGNLLQVIIIPHYSEFECSL